MKSKSLLFIMASLFAGSRTSDKEVFVEEGVNTHPILKNKVSGHRYKRQYGKEFTINGFTVNALNLKNAQRKVRNIQAAMRCEPE